MVLNARVVWLAFAAGVALLTHSLAAQSVRVVATEQGTARPLSGAIAEVIDSTDAVVARGMLSSEGTRVVALPRAGSVRIRIRRVGYPAFLSENLLSRQGSVTQALLVVPARRVVLEGVTVRDASSCSRSAFADASFTTLWDEMAKALTSTELSREGDRRTEVRAYRRILDATTKPIRELVGLPFATSAMRPYAARDPGQLSREGYVMSGDSIVEYLAPDERVLLSEEFLADHCFGTTRGTGDVEGLFGIRFVPLPDRINDIAGTIWIDSASAELRHIDFWYAHDAMPPSARGEGRTGGQVVFQRLSDARWIVSAWRLRMPRYGEARELKRRPLNGFEEFGGVVTPEPGDTTPSPVLAAYRSMLVPAQVRGAVFDSLSTTRLNGARVTIAPSLPPDLQALGLESAGELAARPLITQADSSGAFAFPRVPAGSWRISVTHPGIDSLDVQELQRNVRLGPGGAYVADFAVPSFATLARGCTTAEGSREQRLVTGVIRSAADERTLANALVRVSWTTLGTGGRSFSAVPVQVETRSDSTGTYRVCGVSDSARVIVQAAGPHSSTGEVEAMMGPIGIASVNLRLAEVEPGESEPATGLLSGSVLDSLGHPMRNAVITVDGSSMEARTTADGHYVLAGVPPGTQTVRVRSLGSDATHHTIDVRPASSNTVSFSLARGVLLGRLTTVAPRSALRSEVLDAIHRHKVTGGYLFLEEDLRGRANVAQMLSGLAGVSVGMGGGGVSNDMAILMRTRLSGTCAARVFLDGREIEFSAVQSLPMDELAAVEVFPRFFTAPPWITAQRHTATAPISRSGEEAGDGTNSCGVVLVWTLRH